MINAFLSIHRLAMWALAFEERQIFSENVLCVSCERMVTCFITSSLLSHSAFIFM